MTSTTIYTSENRTPFTYYIKWSKYNISYYGCRYSKNCNPTDSLPPEGFLKGRIPNKYGNKNFGNDMLHYHIKDIS